MSYTFTKLINEDQSFIIKLNTAPNEYGVLIGWERGVIKICNLKNIEAIELILKEQSGNLALRIISLSDFISKQKEFLGMFIEDVQTYSFAEIIQGYLILESAFLVCAAVGALIVFLITRPMWLVLLLEIGRGEKGLNKGLFWAFIIVVLIPTRIRRSVKRIPLIPTTILIYVVWFIIIITQLIPLAVFWGIPIVYYITDKLMIALGLWPRYSILYNIFIKALFCHQEKIDVIIDEIFDKEDKPYKKSFVGLSAILIG